MTEFLNWYRDPVSQVSSKDQVIYKVIYVKMHMT